MALRWLLPIALLLVGCTPEETPLAPAKPFADERAAALHFIKPAFPILDCTDTGSIEQGEVDEHFFNLFFSLDADRSRSISLQEYIRAAYDSTPEKEGFIFDLIDTDGNGAVSTREYRQHLFTAIDLADENGDGEVTELEAGVAPRQVAAK
jgi:hypothetical protein